MSYFTQKMHAALQWHLPGEYEFIVKDFENGEELESRSGTHQIPVVITPENWCIADSTPILTLLDARMPAARFYPRGIVGALTAVLEECFDEWSARWCIATRWLASKMTEETAQQAAATMMAERGVTEAGAGDGVIGWGRRAARAIGVASEKQRAEADEELLRIYGSLNEHLKSHRFVFGDVPTAVDTVLMGGLRAHFLHDLYPKQLLTNAGFTHVQRWHDEWDQVRIPSWREYTHPTMSSSSLPPFVASTLQEMSGPFKRFVLGMVTAHQTKAKAAVVNTYGEDVSYLFRPYTVKSRLMLIDKLKNHLAGSCTPQERDEFKSIISAYGLDELYLSEGTRKSSL